MAAPRSIKADEVESISTATVKPVALERGASITLNATILRVSGPWVDISVLGELQHVLRSRLEKELNNGC